MSYGSIPARFALAAAICALVAGCGVPARQPLRDLRPASALGAQALSGDAIAFPADEWWKGYGDTGLNRVVADALADSPDIAIAAARIRAADAMAQQAGAPLLPQLGAEAAAGAAKQSYNMGFPKQFVPKGFRETGRLTLSLGLDLDLWGRNRALLAAARGEAAAARVDAAQARLLLASGVALEWGQISALEAARVQLVRSADALAQIETLVGQRQQRGLDNKADLALATARRAAAAQELAALDESIALERNRLAALTGHGPDYAATLPHPAQSRALALAAITGVPATLPLDLVGRRPDLVSARLRAEAAASRVEAARRAFYPDINLSVAGGLQSLGFGQLLESDSTYAQAGPALSLPIFQGGRLTGSYRASNAAYDEAVARYDQTLVGAVREVADAITSRRALATRLAEAQAGAAAAEQAASLARIRRSQGLSNLIQQLAAEDSAAQANRALAELQARAFLLDVTLVRALGGGFAAPATGTEPAKP
ncbi:efflux transporter outer membrane subunit [Novosphingobium cyanobacteriorum]|uniref:Efflux transporter outer membrane subunit n=1 Tax=Novosphingobium cyanobacteriorum TaxID=3024215 RepID=A0ABT6CHX1_9SPHN|nr:efflux transporter outer membrane subunit [Novosphingobium cyanobacteriorum]MDF8331937.1 efflux transporter outer membrane subunit [Novosphingobium cyanobacteriorum]